MTLIVGKKIDDEIVLMADTKLTMQNGEGTNPYLEGCIKVYKVTNRIAVAFAGTREHFEDDLKKYFACKSVDEVLDVAIEAFIVDKEYDLIVAEIGRDNLVFVKDGEVTESPFSFIGDSDGYDRFREYWLGSKTANTNFSTAETLLLRLPQNFTQNERADEVRKIFEAMKNTCSDADISTVAGSVVLLCSDDGCFKYVPYAHLITSIDDFLGRNVGALNVTVGSVENASSNMEFFGKTVGGRFNLLLYFYQGKLGVIFSSNEKGLLVPTAFHCDTSVDFALETQKRIGVAVRSGFLDEIECITTGERLLREENFSDAVYCYSLYEDIQHLISFYPERADKYLCGYCNALYLTGNIEKIVELLNKWLPLMTKKYFCDTFVSELREVGVIN